MRNEAGALLKWSLKIYGIIGVIYGAAFLLFPAGYVAFSGADPAPAFVYLRWPGGTLVALGLGRVGRPNSRSSGEGLPVWKAAWVTAVVLA